MKNKTGLIIVCIAIGLFLSFKGGEKTERKNRANYYRNMAEAQSIAYKKERMSRAMLPVEQYVFAEVKDFINNF